MSIGLGTFCGVFGIGFSEVFSKNFLKTLAKSQSAVLYIVRDKVQQKPLFGRDIE